MTGDVVATLAGPQFETVVKQFREAHSLRVEAYRALIEARKKEAFAWDALEELIGLDPKRSYTFERDGRVVDQGPNARGVMEKGSTEG